MIDIYMNRNAFQRSILVTDETWKNLSHIKKKSGMVWEDFVKALLSAYTKKTEETDTE